MLAANLASLYLMTRRRPLYRRHRARIHLALRALRLYQHFWMAVTDPGETAWWSRRGARILAGSSGSAAGSSGGIGGGSSGIGDAAAPAGRAMLAQSLLLLPLLFCHWALLNPLPVALQPPLVAAAVGAYAVGWLPVLRRTWERPAVRGVWLRGGGLRGRIDSWAACT